jgi:membrane protein
VWVYYSAQILFFGAELTQAFARKFGTKIEPSPHAVRVLGRKARVAASEGQG